MRTSFYTSPQKITSRLGDIKISDSNVISEYNERAANETDSALYGVYTVPLAGMTDEAAGEVGEINADLAAGYLILSLASASQSEGVYALGTNLIKSGRDKLAKYHKGSVVIAGATKADPTDKKRYTPRVLSKGADRQLGSFMGDIYQDWDKPEGSYVYPRRDKPW